MGTNYYVGDLPLGRSDLLEDPKFHIGKVCLLHEGRMHFVWAQKMTKSLKTRIEICGVFDERGGLYNTAEFQDVLDECLTSDTKSAGKEFC
jgi:hypothetical protein